MNDEHHPHYNIICKKKKMTEYIFGKPELDIWSFDHLNTHFKSVMNHSEIPLKTLSQGILVRDIFFLTDDSNSIGSLMFLFNSI